MTDSEKLQQVREIMNEVPRRLSNVDKAQEFLGRIRVTLLDPKAPEIMACPMCGHPIDISVRERGTHLVSGYRDPHIQPFLPGSWLYLEDRARDRDDGS